MWVIVTQLRVDRGPTKVADKAVKHHPLASDCQAVGLHSALKECMFAVGIHDSIKHPDTAQQWQPVPFGGTMGLNQWNILPHLLLLPWCHGCFCLWTGDGRGQNNTLSHYCTSKDSFLSLVWRIRGPFWGCGKGWKGQTRAGRAFLHCSCLQLI